MHSAGRGPFPDGWPYLPSGSLRSAPCRRFPARWVSGPVLGEAHYHPHQGSPPASIHRVLRKRRRSQRGCPPALLSALAEASCANLPPRPRVSPGMCPGRRAPSLHSSLCGPAPPLSAGGRVGEIIRRGSGACPGRARASRPRLEGCSTLPTLEF